MHGINPNTTEHRAAHTRARRTYKERSTRNGKGLESYRSRPNPLYSYFVEWNGCIVVERVKLTTESHMSSIWRVIFPADSKIPYAQAKVGNLEAVMTNKRSGDEVLAAMGREMEVRPWCANQLNVIRWCEEIRRIWSCV